MDERMDPVLKARNVLLEATQRDFSGWNQFRAGWRAMRVAVSLGFRRAGVSRPEEEKKKRFWQANERSASSQISGGVERSGAAGR